MKPELLNYDALAELGIQENEGVLDSINVMEGGIAHFKTLLTVDQKEMDNYWCWKFSKGSTNFLLSYYDDEGNMRVLKDTLPIRPTKTRTVSYQGKVFELIEEFKPVGYRKIKKLSGKQLVDNLNAIPHTNSKHRALLIMQGLTQYYTRAYFRVSTNPGFGKDNVSNTMQNLVGKCGTITNPSVARLEQETVTTRWLAITEITKIPKGKWDEDELFLLDCCDHSPTTKKRSKSHGIVGDILNLRNFSVSLFYNDITDTVNVKKYFDNFADKPLHDRFIPFRLHGTFTHDFADEAIHNVGKFVKEHKQEYLDIIYTITWFADNYNKLRNPYSNKKLLTLTNRERVSMLRLLKTISFYCDSQVEYDEWIKIINDSIIDYRSMIMYPDMLEAVTGKMNKLSPAYASLIKELNAMKTFTERLIRMDNLLKGKPKVTGETLW